MVARWNNGKHGIRTKFIKWLSCSPVKTKLEVFKEAVSDRLLFYTLWKLDWLNPQSGRPNMTTVQTTPLDNQTIKFCLFIEN